MPELPEVETVRRDLERNLVGKRIEHVAAGGVHRLRRHSPASELVARLTGRRLVGIRRRGKYLVADLAGGDALVMHLGMSGQLRLTPADAPLAPHSHVVLHLEGGHQLRFVDPRTFGELFVTTTEPVTGDVAELAHLGLDALDNGLTWPQAAGLFAGRRTRLKPLLMDQRFLAGIGNIYADEILWGSRLRADRPACDLAGEEIRRLWRTRRSTLRLAIDHRGSSLTDSQYRDLSGSAGGYQVFHQAYGREGLPCRRCRTSIVRVVAAGRSGFSCPRCQV